MAREAIERISYLLQRGTNVLSTRGDKNVKKNSYSFMLFFVFVIQHSFYKFQVLVYVYMNTYNALTSW